VNYTVLLRSRAQRDRRKLQTSIRERVDEALTTLESDARPPGCKKLTNSDEWRIRVGRYRVRYLIDDSARVVKVTRIGHRRDVYDS
jgi:mRNA interferase RelE/StbE